MFIEPVVLTTDDGLKLEAELTMPTEAATGAAVLAHPHPQQGGNMRSIVPGTLFAELPRSGIAALRFNFRGVGESEGAYDNGRGEQRDVIAAVDRLESLGVPIILAGWSFGADVSLAVGDDRIRGWFAAAPPLRSIDPDTMAAATDPRPKLLAVPERDQFCPPAYAAAVTADWPSCRIEVIAGADHFFVGRTDRLTPLCLELFGAAG